MTPATATKHSSKESRVRRRARKAKKWSGSRSSPDWKSASASASGLAVSVSGVTRKNGASASGASCRGSGSNSVGEVRLGLVRSWHQTDLATTRANASSLGSSRLNADMPLLPSLTHCRHREKSASVIFGPSRIASIARARGFGQQSNCRAATLAASPSSIPPIRGVTTMIPTLSC